MLSSPLLSLLNTLENKPKPFQISIICLSTFVISAIDYFTGYEISFSLFYIAPIALTTWLFSTKAGVALSLISALAWYVIEKMTSHSYSSQLFLIWNMLVRLIFFVLIVYLIGALKQALFKEIKLSLTDALTSLPNVRAFYQTGEALLNQAIRNKQPVSLAFMDLDNFKQLNDSQGHLEGDKALRIIAQFMTKKLRRSDLIARMGGDEFAILLVGPNMKQCENILHSLHDALLQLMAQHNYPVGFSIGAVSLPKISDFDSRLSDYKQTQLEQALFRDLLKQADDLMYEVKRTQKNKVKIQTLQQKTGS